jgi:murein DD-endopeptidase MepM/ murein hydrolase activator NlpD
LITDQQIQAALRLITGKLYAAENDLAVARAHLQTVDLSIKTTQRKVASIGSQMGGRQNVIDQRAAALYMLGPTGGMEALQSSKNVSDYVARAGALDFIGTFDRTILQDLAGLRHRQVLAQRELGIERQHATSVAREVNAHVKLVAEAARAQQEAHAIAQRRVAAYTTELKDEIAQQKLIEAILSRGSTFRGVVETNPSKYGFQWPTNSHQINSPFGPRGGGYHTGIDIHCTMGEPLMASRAGKVTAKQWGGGYGNMTVIDHGDGHATLYAHQSRQYVSDGQQVVRGQVIGACGSTGNSTGPHLHFEMHLNGYSGGPTSWCRTCVNPRPYLP